MSEVIYFSSDEVGIPQLSTSGGAGTVVAILDACLVNGFNAKSVTSLAVSGGVATATISAHGYLKGRKLLFAGATGLTGLNGVKRLLSVTSNTVTFDATGVPDGSATGAITAKRAPLGWVKTYGDANHAVYTRTDVAATTQVLAVSDSDATYCRVWGAESASDMSTFVSKFPTDVQLSGGAYWPKRGGNITTWALVGDGLSFYFFPNGSNSSPTIPGGFGDLVSYRAGDAYNSFLGATTGETNSNFLGGQLQNAAGGVVVGFGWLCRDSSGFIKSPPMADVAVGMTYNGAQGQPYFPSIVDNGLVIEDRMLVMESSGVVAPLRGHQPGIARPIAQIPANMHNAVISGVTGSTREYLVQYISVGNGSNHGAVLVDLTGPWQ